MLYDELNQSYCTAIILSPTWVLSSQKCTMKTFVESNWSLYYGNTEPLLNTTDRTNREFVKVQYVVPHPKVLEIYFQKNNF